MARSPAGRKIRARLRKGLCIGCGKSPCVLVSGKIRSRIIAAAWPAAKKLASKRMYREVTGNKYPSETRFSTHAKAQATFMLSFVE